MKIVCWISSFFILFGFGYLIADPVNPSEPTEPEMDEISIPDVVLEVPDLVSNKNDLYQYFVLLQYSDGMEQTGTVSLTNNPIFYFTNMNNGIPSVKTLSLYEVERIEIVKWQPVKQNNETYLFLPNIYRFYTDQSSNFMEYWNNIPDLNAMLLTDENYKKMMIYTIFYDKWIAGKKNIYRWENSQATSFSFNFDNPINGVVRNIRFSR